MIKSWSAEIFSSPPYPSGQLQEVAVDVDRSFFPGLPLLNDELIRLDLVPPQLQEMPIRKPK